jgi:hypothetical protein
MKITLTACPVCQHGVFEYAPEDDENYEHWRFECGAEIIRIGSRLLDENPCRIELEKAVQAINAANEVVDETPVSPEVP